MVMLPLNFSDNITDWNTTLNDLESSPLKWGMLSLIGFIFLTATGNILVCLAVCWERRLQNMTNYFLMSLAIADLLVAILVMPFGMIVEIFSGYFPLGASLCTLWVTFDVGLCTASIWHMCTMSMDRFFTLKYPMKYGRNKTKTMVLLKITFVWIMSIAICSPVCFSGFLDNSTVFNDGFCAPTMSNFIIYGSVFAFYVPLMIMVVTYVLTLQILRNNSKFMRKMEKSRKTVMRKHIAGYNNNKNRNFLTPNGYGNGYDNEVSNESALVSRDVTDNSFSGELLSDTKLSSDFTGYTTIQPIDKLKNKPSPIPILPLPVLQDESETAQSPPWEPTTPLCEAASPIFRKKDRLDSITSGISGRSCGSGRSKSFLSLPVGSRHNLSTSVESLVSIHGPGIILERPEVQDKLSQIEIEMETYLTTDEINDNIENENKCEQELANEKRFNSCTDNGNEYSYTDNENERCEYFDNELVEDKFEFYDRPNESGKCAYLEHENKFDFIDADTEKCRPLDEDNNAMGYNLTDAATHQYPRTPQSRRTPSPCPSTSSSGTNTNSSIENPECQALNPSPRSFYDSDMQPGSVEDNTDEGNETEDLTNCGDRYTPTDHELLTLSIKANGMYVYKVKYSKSSNQISEYMDEEDPTYCSKPPHQVVESPARLEVADISGVACRLPKSRSCSEVYLKGTDAELMREITERRASAQRMMETKYKQNIIKLQRPNHFKQKKRKKIMRSFIPKRTANNEKKASKVLGIIFGVFVILWTPFFTLNVMSVTCDVCMTNVTPEIMSTVLWFGWIASLANPIIYTMFNTSFRHAFYKILMCKYKKQRRVTQTPESHFLTSPSNWINSDTRRNTVTMQLN
ncbi:uncharacterized protein LOC135494739 [Lineus longissimus]|uniref:uncharacterized protein LOC135494739 n=1 Tax=Lineus longissimus TaxID=88925 RepID=UPI002B4EC082